MAPPIPPDEPVISAVFPVKSNIKASPRRWNLNLALLERGQHGLDFLRRLGTLRGQRTLDAPVEAGQHLAGAEPDHRLDALRSHVGDRLAPAHHPRHLPDHLAAALVRDRSDARRLGKEWVSRWKYRGWA